MADDVQITGTIGPADRNKYLGALADVLRSGASTAKVARKAGGSGLLPTIVQSLLEGPANVVDDMSYGRMPFQVNPNTGVPRVSPWASGSDIIDTASFVPGGQVLKGVAAAKELAALLKGAGVSKATLLPAIPTLFRNADARLAKDLEKRIAIAEDMQRGGAQSNDIWQDTRLFRQQGQSGEFTPTKQAKWGFEIPEGVWNTSIAPDSSVPLAEVLKHPQLARLLPEVMDTSYATGSKISTPFSPTARAHYSQADKQIAIGEALRTGGLENPLISTNNHELNHVINALTGQRGSTGYSMLPLTQTARDRIPGIGLIIDEQFKMPELAQQLYKFDPTEPHINRWGRSVGEQLADEAGARSIKMKKRAEVGFIDPANLMAPPYVSPEAVPDNISNALGRVLYWNGRQPPTGFSPQHFDDKTYATRLIKQLRDTK